MKFLKVKTITGPLSYAQAEGLFRAVAEVREKAADEDLGKLSGVLNGESGEPEKPKKKKLFGQVQQIMRTSTHIVTEVSLLSATCSIRPQGQHRVYGTELRASDARGSWTGGGQALRCLQRRRQRLRRPKRDHLRPRGEQDVGGGSGQVGCT